MKPTTLYRLFDADDELLYVGIAGNPGRRFEQHAGEKPWWGDVAHTVLEHFATREEALAAERQAIAEEHPIYNVVHSIREGRDRVVTLVQHVRMVCAGCDSVIQGATGYLEVDNAAAYQQAMRTRAADRDQTSYPFRRASDVHFEAPMPWVAWHRKCDPFPEASSYWIGSDRLTTWAELMEWTAHISEKVWAEHTTWFEMIRSVDAASTPLRVTTERKTA